MRVPTEPVVAPALPVEDEVSPRRSRRRHWGVPGVAALTVAVAAGTIGWLRPGDSTPTADDSTPTADDSTSAPDDSTPTDDLPGWRQVFSEDFDIDAPLGGFYSVPHYDERWTGYEDLPDTSGEGTYRTADTLSVHDGVLDIWLRTEDGVPLASAPIPLVDGEWGGQLYGRFEVRFRADPVEGYKMAWLLWPDSDVWADGEIDWPEGRLDGQMYAANLQVGRPGEFDLVTDPVASFDEWHTATTEWTPDGVTFYLDGEEIGFSDVSPSDPMHWVLQTETAYGKPPADSEGHVEIDRVTIYELDETAD